MNYKIEEYSENLFSDLADEYGSPEINALTYKIIGAAMEVHSTIGKGFSEIAYKDCLSIEFDKREISYQKEKKYEIVYKGVKIPHHYYTDFIIEGQVIIEVKAQTTIIEENIKQLMNYLAVSGCSIGLLINFGDSSLKFKRVILSK